MAGSLNKVTLIGNLGSDPEFRSTQNGDEIARFSVATSESWKDRNSGERRERTEWHRVVIFSRGLVGVAKSYLRKGSKVYLEGQMQTRKWQDKEGRDVYTTEVVLQNFNSQMIMLDGRRDGDFGGGRDGGDRYGSHRDAPASAPASAGRAAAPAAAADFDDEIPF